MSTYKKALEFFKEYGIEFSAFKVKVNPNMENSEKKFNFHIEMMHKGRSYSSYFSQSCIEPIKYSGMKVCAYEKQREKLALENKYPDLYAFFDCIVLDAQSVSDNESFDDWCSNFGYSNDSIKAKASYDLIRACRVKLLAVIDIEYMEEIVGKLRETGEV